MANLFTIISHCYGAFSLAKNLHAQNTEKSTFINNSTVYYKNSEVKPKIDTEKLNSIKLCGNELQIIICQKFSYSCLNQEIMELLLTIDCFNNYLGETAYELKLILPYLPYSRQDKIFEPGEPSSLYTLINLLKSKGVDKLLTYNLHGRNSEELSLQTGTRINDINILPKLLERALVDLGLKPQAGDELCLVAPDKGRSSQVKQLSQLYNTQFIKFDKSRTQSGIKTRICQPEKLNPAVNNYIILDDMLDGGTTLAKTASILKERSAEANIYGVITHSLLPANAHKKLENSCIQKIYTTDSFNSQLLLGLENAKNNSNFKFYKLEELDKIII